MRKYVRQAAQVLSVLFGLASVNAAPPMEQRFPEDRVSMIECEYNKNEDKLSRRYDEQFQNGTYHYRVYLPEGYYASGGQRYPCLFIGSPKGNASMENVKAYVKSNHWTFLQNFF